MLGGAIGRVPADATAYAHRASKEMVNVIRIADGDLDEAIGWTAELGRAIAAIDQGDPGAYVNFLGPGDADRIHAAYPGDTLTRLRRVKAADDPTNLFRHNDNIAVYAEP